MVPVEDDFIDYNNELRLGILDAYSGIMQGMGPNKCEQYLKNEVPGLVEFASSIGAEADPDSSVAKSTVNMLGDVCSVMAGVGPLLRSSPRQEWLKLVSSCKESSLIQEDCEWAMQQIEVAMHS